MKKYTVVIPVYNVEKHLERCLNSVIKQTYSNLEIIVINDGSTDSSFDIAKSFAKFDERIVLVNQNNKGLSAVRNKGIKLSTSKYILFVDSDDYIEDDTIEKFDEVIANRNLDIVAANGCKSYLAGKNEKIVHTLITNPNFVSGEYFLEQELKSRTMRFISCFNMYNRDFLIKNDILYKEGVLYEDQHFSPRAFLKAKKVVSTDIVFYNYLEREDSITTTVDKSKAIEDIVEITKELEILYKNLDNKKLRKLLNDNLLDLYLGAFYLAGEYNPEKKSLFSRKFTLNKAGTNKNRIKTLLFILNKDLYLKFNKLSKK